MTCKHGVRLIDGQQGSVHWGLCEQPVSMVTWCGVRSNQLLFSSTGCLDAKNSLQIVLLHQSMKHKQHRVLLAELYSFARSSSPLAAQSPLDGGLRAIHPFYSAPLPHRYKRVHRVQTSSLKSKDLATLGNIPPITAATSTHSAGSLLVNPCCLQNPRTLFANLCSMLANI